MTEAKKTEAEVILANSKQPMHGIGEDGTPFVMLPPEWAVHDLTRFLEAPKRCKEQPEFSDVRGFDEYIEKHGKPKNLWLDERNFTFTAIFNASGENGYPGFGDHRAILKLQKSSEWEKWKKANSTAMSPSAFAEFLENNIAYVGDEEFPASKLLDMCRRLRVSVKGDMSVDELDVDGTRELIASASMKVKGETRDGLKIPFPEFMPINLRVFQNMERYTFRTRLRWRCDAGKVTFLFDLQNVDLIEEEALNAVLNSVSDKTGMKLWKGVYK